MKKQETRTKTFSEVQQFKDSEREKKEKMLQDKQEQAMRNN